jgi:hypothetical protein
MSTFSKRAEKGCDTPSHTKDWASLRAILSLLATSKNQPRIPACVWNVATVSAASITVSCRIEGYQGSNSPGFAGDRPIKAESWKFILAGSAARCEQNFALRAAQLIDEAGILKGDRKPPCRRPVRGLSPSRSGLQTHIAMTVNFRDACGEKLTPFVGPGSAIRLAGICVDGFVPLSKLDAVWNRGQGRKLFFRSFLLLFQMCTARVHPPGTN